MMEGITLENTGEVHIMDVYYTLGRIDQVVGRAIRQCKHYKVTSEKNQFPEVKIYKYYHISTNKDTTDEIIEKYANMKQYLLKQIIDCAIESSIEYVD